MAGQVGSGARSSFLLEAPDAGEGAEVFGAGFGGCSGEDLAGTGVPALTYIFPEPYDLNRRAVI
jgi:hypothetical protein